MFFMGEKALFQLLLVACFPGQHPELVKGAPVPHLRPAVIVLPLRLGGKVLQPVPVHAQVVQLAGRERRRRDGPPPRAVMVQGIRQADGLLALKHQMQHAGIVPEQHGLIVVDVPLPEQPDVEQLVPGQRPVKAAGLESLQNQRHGVNFPVLPQDHGLAGDGGVLLIDGVPGAGGDGRAAVPDGVQQRFVHGGFDEVIGVHKTHIIAPRVVQPHVGGRRRAAVGLVEHPDAGVGFGKFIAQLTAAVGAAVLHQQQLKIREGLRKDAGHRAGQVVFGVVHAGDDADGGVGHRELL